MHPHRFSALAFLLAAGCALAVAPRRAHADETAAAALAVESLGEPVRTMRLTGENGEFLIPKPGGAGWWLLLSYHPVSRSPLPNQVFIIDLDAAAVTERTFADPPGALCGTACIAGKDGNYYIGHYATPGLYRFSPADGSLRFMVFDELRSLRILPYRICIAEDGMIYMGTASASARIIAFDPANDAFRDLGVPGPKHGAPRYVYSMAVDEQYVYCAAGKNPWYLTATDRSTGAHQVLLSDVEYLEVSGGKAGAVAWATVKDAAGQTSKAHYRLTGGAAQPTGEPAPLTEAQRNAARAERSRIAESRPELSLDVAHPDSGGNATVAWRMPGQSQWRSVNLTGIQTTGWPLHTIGAMADGRIFAAPAAYEDVCNFDPATGRFDLPGKAPLSIGATVAAGDRLFLLGYPGTYIVEYDPSRPWTYATAAPGREAPPLSDPASNPRECHRYSPTLQTHYVRAAALGADGLVYFGAHAERASVGGSLGWWDPATREPGGLREPFLVHDCAGLAAARDGWTIVYASHPVADPRGVTPTPDGAALFTFDVKSRTVTGSIKPAEGLKSCGPIVAFGDRVHGLAVTGDSKRLYYQVDLTSGHTLTAAPVAGALRSNLAVGPDQRVYFILDQKLVRLDPAQASISPVGDVDVAGPIAFSGPDLYIAHGSTLLRIKGVATP